MAASQISSRLEMLQARFQQKQLQEKEQKLLQLYDQQQQRAYQIVQRSSAGSNGSNHASTARTTTTAYTTSTSQGGKVRQMFDERRQTTVKGIDRSYPLEPLENKLRKHSTNANNVASQGNNNFTVNRQSVSMRRVTRADVNSNVNSGKPIVSYSEEVIRESCRPPVHRYDDEDEFEVDNRIAAFANRHRHDDIDNEQEAIDQETIERNRSMTKLHLMGFDGTHRVRNYLESEEFPKYLMEDMPDKFPKKNITKKLSQAEMRLERFKNVNTKKNDMSKPSTTSNNLVKRRSEQTVPKSNFKITKSPNADAPMTKQHGTTARATKGSIPSSPSKSPDIVTRQEPTGFKNHEAKSSKRQSGVKDAELIGSKTTDAEVMDAAKDVLQNGSPHEYSKKSNAFAIDYNDQLPKENNSAPLKKAPPTTKSHKPPTTQNSSGRPTSSVLSNRSVNTVQGQDTKNKMTTKSKMQPKGPFSTKNVENVNAADNLIACNTCGRRFAQDRISLHEQICVKTMNKKRKQFDAVMVRVRGTELEPFVKKGFAKKQESKIKKPETKPSNWRRKHEDFINTIRSAKQAQAHVAAGGKLSDLPLPPASDTSDYIQCPHCGRKFNQAAAERHIPKCKHMLHNKPAHARAPKLKR